MATEPRLRLAAIITAAGRSSRMDAMDKPKQLLPWNGKPLVTHQCDVLLAAGLHPVVVVTGYRGDEVAAAVPTGCVVVHHPGWARGRSTSIEAAAAALPDDCDGVLMVAVDQPLAVGVAEALLTALHERPEAPLIQPVDAATGRPGHPVLLGLVPWRQLRTLGDRPEGLRSVVRPLRSDAVLVSVSNPMWDLNTPEDYRKACAEAGLTR